VKVLIANRGEIAIRIMRACRDLGLSTVAVYSDADRRAPHVRYADEAYHLGGNAAAESYLSIDKLIDVARRAKADAVHPGYGFLAENEDFAEACVSAGLTFIGPSADAIRQMGSKTEARIVAKRAGVPLVPGTDGALSDSLSDAEVAAIAADIGYPLMVKAVAGGGGKGMRQVAAPGDLAAALRAARSEAGSAFGDSAVYLERHIDHPRHIEIQLLADSHGCVIPFVERECSIQRRHQKVVEESPSPVMTPELRAKMTAAAANVARAVGYTNAGTIEFLVDASGGFYFLEMNTRLQVEHPVTEMVTQLDLVAWQIRIARGERLTIDPARAVTPRGHAIECRIYAEDPDAKFMPSPGLIQHLRAPAGPGIRDDSGVASGFEVPIFYDSMISKLIAWGDDRAQATARMQRALSEYEVRGIKTTIPFFTWLLQTDDFRAARFDTTSLDRELAARAGRPFVEVPAAAEEVAVVAAALHAFFRAVQPARSPASSGGRGQGQGQGQGAASTWLQTARREAVGE
jgi:acetyl-CoA carboxylase, biotin carboxylase subunit